MRLKLSTVTGFAATAVVGFALAGCGIGSTEPGLRPPECELENAPPSCNSGDPPVENVAPVDPSRGELVR